MELKEIIEQGLVDELKALLSDIPGYANQKITWGSRKEIETDPLHYVSDCVFNGLLTNGKEADIASVLLASGAHLEGSEKAESPLIGAASLSVEGVARVLIEAGADINAISIYGANALHWAAYVGLPGIVSFCFWTRVLTLKESALLFKPPPSSGQYKVLAKAKSLINQASLMPPAFWWMLGQTSMPRTFNIALF